MISTILSLLISFNLPVDRFYAVAFQKLICLAERPVAKESPERRQRTRMRCRQDQMLRIVQHKLLPLGRTSPQDEYNRPVLLIEDLDGRVRELLPPDLPMGICLMGSDCKNRIQHQD